jgi:asparagine synthase (glutamine-hydrolysing)
MCGIAGNCFFPQENVSNVVEAVQRMNLRMKTRGPDSQELWKGSSAVLGHSRLAIQDLDSRSNQPFVSADGNFILVFNGEIYNFQALRNELQNLGMTFRTSSDSEVLLALFIKEGVAMLPKLRGMFAFAVWDIASQSLFMARDPYGIKPLFYSATPNGFVFASQVKALQASGLVSKEMEPAGLAGFYLWGSVPGPWTLFQNVFALLPGHYLQVNAGRVCVPVCWHDMNQHWQAPICEDSTLDLPARVRQAVTESVKAHLVADVPVGVFLSGGIDSGVLAGLANQLGARVEAITISFSDFSNSSEDETHAAAATAAQYGLPHHVRKVTHAEFLHDLPLILDAMDQPTVDGVNTWFASKAAAECGFKVVLSGLGGDELFCGYSNFSTIPWAAVVGKFVSALGVAVPKTPFNLLALLLQSPKLAGVPAHAGSIEGIYFLKRGLFMPNELTQIMGPELAREGLARLGGSPPGMPKISARDGASAVGMMESLCYLKNQLLPDSDWASMAHSLELRTPLVDVKLLASLGNNLPDFTKGRGKKMLAMAPLQPIHEWIINRPKTGFGTPLTKNWLDNGLPNSFPYTSWARRWAILVANSFCNSNIRL